MAVLSALGGLGGGIIGLLMAGLMAIAGYYIWAYVTLWVGKQFYGVTADIGAIQRAIGFAYAPRVLSFFAWIPCIGWLVAFVGSLWSLALGVFAVREIMGLDTTEAIVVTIVGWLIVFLVTVVLGAIFGIGALGSRHAERHSHQNHCSIKYGCLRVWIASQAAVSFVANSTRC